MVCFIIIVYLGHLKLTDFGLVHKNNTSNDKFCGTLYYMAPETLSNKNLITSESIDMWSLGIILYELLMGHAPYDMDSK
jgi:serine/threonine protein kinase